MTENINHILNNKNCVYWNATIIEKLVEDFKTHYDKKHVIYNQYLYILENGKNYIDKVRLFIKHFIYIWSVNNSIISDKESQLIWKTYVSNFTLDERAAIVTYIKNMVNILITDKVIKSKITDKNADKNADKIKEKGSPDSHEYIQIKNQLQEAHDTINTLTTKFTALNEIYTTEKSNSREVLDKYLKLESEYHTLCSNYSEVYKMAEFRSQRIEDLSELNSRLKNTIDELRSSREMYRDLYSNNGKY